MPNLGDHVAAPGQLDERRQPGSPYFEPDGARVRDAILAAELAQAGQKRPGASYTDADLLGRGAPWYIDGMAPEDRPENDARHALAELRRALDGVTALLGPAVAAGLDGAPLTGRDELRETTPGRLDRLDRAVRELATARYATLRRAEAAERETGRLLDELDAAQTAHDARVDPEKHRRAERQLEEWRDEVRYLELALKAAETVARQIDRRHTGDARTAGTMLRRARLAAAAARRAEAAAEAEE